jgi:hypothetical protein
VRARSEQRSDDSKESFYEELEHVSNHFPKYQMKNVLGNFNAKMGRIFSKRQFGMRVYIMI